MRIPQILGVVCTVAVSLAVVSSAAAQPPTAQIIGGTAVPNGSAPYAVSVQYLPPVVADGFLCTGSLVAPQWVLTAGHCSVDDAGAALAPLPYHVIVGSSDRTMGTSLMVSEVHPYPYYNPATLQGDAALLKLASPAPAPAATIPLASPAQSSLYAAGQPATAMGWGVTSIASNATASTILQMGTVTVQSNATCAAGSFGQPFYPAYDMCASAPDFMPSTCHGDSGGPLVANTPAGPVEIGVVSYGFGTCIQSAGFYTRTSSIQSWVTSVINPPPAPAPPPPPFTPPFAAPTVTAALSADGIVATLATQPDPATLATGLSVALVNSAGTVLSSQSLAATTTSVSFPHLQPGSYAVAAYATYSEGISTTGTSAGVTLAPPANATKPAVTGKTIAGSTLTCHTGTWTWPGTSTLALTWLRSGVATGATTPTYRLGTDDAGKSIACRVVLTASTGPTVSALSGAVLAHAKLAVRARPRVTGSRLVGTKLVCHAGAWNHTGALKLSYRWLRNGKPLAGRSASHLVVRADSNRRLSCRVTASTGGQTASATTKPVLASI